MNKYGNMVKDSDILRPLRALHSVPLDQGIHELR